MKFINIFLAIFILSTCLSCTSNSKKTDKADSSSGSELNDACSIMTTNFQIKQLLSLKLSFEEIKSTFFKAFPKGCSVKIAVNKLQENGFSCKYISKENTDSSGSSKTNLLAPLSIPGIPGTTNCSSLIINDKHNGWFRVLSVKSNTRNEIEELLINDHSVHVD